MLELAEALPTHADAGRWRDAVRLYIDDYVAPMSARSAYDVMPLGLYLAAAARVFRKPEYRDAAYRQLEWVMGNNPFGACLMWGEGWRNSYPYSRFVGPIIGGIVNGVAGNAQDVPILEMEYGNDWRTGEYWTPHNAFYLWAVSRLEEG